MSSVLGPVSILAVVAIQFLLIRSVSSLNLTNTYLSHNCNNTQARYKPGSVFEKNLNRVIHNISSSDLRKGFTYSTNVKFGYKVSKDPNIVFVLLQCRGDSYGSHCHSCFKAALRDLRKRCPGNRGATIWYDQCLLDISSADSEHRIHYQNIFCMSNRKNVSGNQQEFNEKKKAFINSLVKKSVQKEKDEMKGPLYASGEMKLGTKTMYAMVQCTNDILETGCEVCHEYLDIKYKECSDGKAGARVVGRSCNFRYEFYPFLRNLKTV